MKTLLIFSVAFVLGIAATLAFQNPARVQRAASSTVEVVESKVSEVQRSRCTSEFNRRTACFQNKPAKECDALIAKECGLPQ